MPRYFFNVYDGRSAMDTEGTELADQHSIRREAIRLAGHILRDEADRLLPDEEWRLEVVDTADRLLLTVDFSLTEEPAVPSLMSTSG